MRYPVACIATDIMGCLPFVPKGIEGGAEYQPFPDGVPWQKMYAWWYRVSKWIATVTVNTTSGSVAYGITLERDSSGFDGEGERAYIRPGVRDEILIGTQPLLASRWNGGIATDGDSAFPSGLTLDVQLDLCGLLNDISFYGPSGPYPNVASRYGIDLLKFLPAARMAIVGNWDGGPWWVQSANPPAYVADIPPDLTEATASMDGLDMTAWLIQGAPSNPHTSAPDVTIEPLEWFEFRKSDGTEPIFDKDTGEVLPGQTPFTQVL